MPLHPSNDVSQSTSTVLLVIWWGGRRPRSQAALAAPTMASNRVLIAGGRCQRWDDLLRRARCRLRWPRRGGKADAVVQVGRGFRSGARLRKPDRAVERQKRLD